MSRNILLVEDDPFDADLTLAALEDFSVRNEVFVVHGGQEALDYLYCRGKFKQRPRRHPAVMLLDHKSPKAGVLELLKTVKSDEQLKAIPVVVLASSRETRDLTEFYRHGVNAYVVTPAPFAEYMSTVKQLGAFWAAVNEPPPDAPREAESMDNNGKQTDRVLK